MTTNHRWVPTDSCKRTVELLQRLPQPRIAGCSPNAVFSVLSPGTTIPPHTGVANTRLLCHLPLSVPAGCWFRVGGETRNWERGHAFVFDDAIEHEAVRLLMEADAGGAALAL